MTAQAMWAQYTAMHPEAASAAWEAWAYGDDPDTLAALTLRGVKTATSSAHALYALASEPLPAPGEWSVLLNGRDEAVCILRTVRVQVVPFCEVSAEHAFREGEGDRTLAWWRQVHERFFWQAYEQSGLPWTEDIPVVCEEFEVMYP